MTGALTVRWSTGERTFEPGAVIRVGRDDSSEVVIDNRNVSRKHAEVTVDPAGRWVFTDLESSQGSYLYGARSQQFVIAGQEIVMLGRAPGGEVVEFTVSDRRPGAPL
jgi:pSer/pThr/pTyr-binding forkhead associated (FHA) protein